ncbi:MAG: cysteine--tRNA ligase [Patescibacteria group bacterium]|nr:cysteine--tRNA ligase [Patescibacteria group bacterium]MDE2590729.1 cysteine--tRNA ligase [Patescibacteria group bacterium]
MVRLYNTLTHAIEEFKPLHDNEIAMYSCGPTVYDYQHIGHMRRYIGDDILIRVLQWMGYKVKHVMNITDVGHLSSDSDSGEDKMEKGAKKFGLSVWDIARKFEKQFFDSTDALNIMRPDVLMHATDYIDEQIDLIEVLDKKGYVYKIDGDGIYFDTSKFKDYFKLSRQNPDELKKGARIEFVEGKKNPADFALWKFSPKNEKRQMEWESPWGVGFPGWHIECSAMAMDALGSTLDIHTGGIDHIAVHHTNEIAQSECATGKQFVRYWVHHNFLVVEEQKMSKSLGNIFTVADVEKKGFDPMALRYLYLQTHYRQEMNFTWEALEAAQTAYHKLIRDYRSYIDKNGIPSKEYLDIFTEALNDDLNTAKAVSILWEMMKSDIPENVKAATLQDMDGILGLRIIDRELDEETVEIPADIQKLVEKREELRKAGKYDIADTVRSQIEEKGFSVTDTNEGSKIGKIK